MLLTLSAKVVMVQGDLVFKKLKSVLNCEGQGGDSKRSPTVGVCLYFFFQCFVLLLFFFFSLASVLGHILSLTLSSATFNESDY